jgi:hypothetical protein
MTVHVQYDQINDQWVVTLNGPVMQEISKKAQERGYCVVQCIMKAVDDIVNPTYPKYGIDRKPGAPDLLHPIPMGTFGEALEASGVAADNLHRPTRHTPRAQKPAPNLAEEIRADNEAVDRLSRLLNRLRGEER